MATTKFGICPTLFRMAPLVPWAHMATVTLGLLKTAMMDRPQGKARRGGACPTLVNERSNMQGTVRRLTDPTTKLEFYGKAPADRPIN
jgi:hypothetical protein